jgi:hypothetical protein
MSPFFDDLERQLHAAAAAAQQRAHRRWWQRPRNIALLAVAALGAGTPAIARVSGVWDPGVEPLPRAATATVSASASTTCHEQPAAALSPDPRLDPALVAQIAVLRRPQRADDEPPAAPGSRGGGPVIDPASSRYVGSVAGRRFYAVAASSRVHVFGCGQQPATNRLDLCLLEESGGGGCGTPAKAFGEQGLTGSSAASAGDDSSIVAGLVPDEVTTVTVRYGTSERSFTIKDNFYGFEIAVPAERQPDATIWTLRNGQRRKVG